MNSEQKKQDKQRIKTRKRYFNSYYRYTNKNIELYYVVYIIFVTLFVIVQSSILIFNKLSVFILIYDLSIFIQKECP